MSKAQAITQIANGLLANGGANSVLSATETVKRAWRRFNTGCHFAAAQLMLDTSVFEQTPIGWDFATITTISFAEKLRTMAEMIKPRHGSTPVLDSTITWKVPRQFPLSAIKVVNWKDGSGTIETAMTRLPLRRAPA